MIYFEYVRRCIRGCKKTSGKRGNSVDNSGIKRMLAKQFPTEQSVISELINLKAILNLPKGTEHFLSDIHGESETFLHILRNASGVIRVANCVAPQKKLRNRA